MTDTDSRTTVIDPHTTASPPSADRTFPPSAEFAANANLTAEAYQRAAADPEAFWAEQANRLTWATPFTQVLDWSDAPHAKLVRRRHTQRRLQLRRPARRRRPRRHRRHPLGGRTRRLPDHHLRRAADEVCKTANALLSLGLQAGDRVAIYLPMIPEAVFAMLACARLGLAHGVVFAGFSAEALRSRIGDAAGPGGDHRRRAVPPRHRRAAQGRRRRGRRRRRLAGGARAGGPPHRHRRHLDRARTCGGTSWSTASPTSTPRRRSPPSNRCSCCTRPAPPGNPRASCTPPAGTSPRPPTPTTPCSTTNPAPTCTGAPPISAGSPGTPTSSTGRWPTGPPRSSTRAPRTPRTRAGTGRSSTSTRCRSTTPRRP